MQKGFKHKKGMGYIPIKPHHTNFLSTVEIGCLDIRLVKDDKEIIYGIEGYPKAENVILWPKGIFDIPNDDYKKLNALFGEVSFSDILKECERILNIN